jgi:hypothetical protein
LIKPIDNNKYIKLPKSVWYQQASALPFREWLITALCSLAEPAVQEGWHICHGFDSGVDPDVLECPGSAYRPDQRDTFSSKSRYRACRPTGKPWSSNSRTASCHCTSGLILQANPVDTCNPGQARLPQKSSQLIFGVSSGSKTRSQMRWYSGSHVPAGQYTWMP